MSLGTCVTKYPVYVNGKMYAAVVDLETQHVKFYNNKYFLGKSTYIYSPIYFVPLNSYVNLISDGIRSYEAAIAKDKLLEKEEQYRRKELDDRRKELAEWDGRCK